MTLANLNVGILFILAMSSIRRAGGIHRRTDGSNNKYALFGAMRVIAMLD